MPWYRIECETERREVYAIEAQSKAQAQEILYRDAPEPVVGEVIAFTVEQITELKERE